MIASYNDFHLYIREVLLISAMKKYVHHSFATQGRICPYLQFFPFQVHGYELTSCYSVPTWNELCYVSSSIFGPPDQLQTTILSCSKHSDFYAYRSLLSWWNNWIKIWKYSDAAEEIIGSQFQAVDPSNCDKANGLGSIWASVFGVF